MRKLTRTALIVVTIAVSLSIATRPAAAQPAVAPVSSAPTWADPANWHSVKPVETDNIVYATVAHIANPSAEASPNPGTPNGIRTPIANTGPAGTLDMHLDVYQVPSAKPTPVVIQIHGGGGFGATAPARLAASARFFPPE